MTDTLPLGTRVTFSREAFRIRSDGGKRFWDAPPWQDRLPSKTGVIVGVRYLQNGHIDSGYMYESNVWISEGTVKAYLIAYDLRKKPVYVFPEHVKPELTRATA